jgi:GNAT superfamily N-acetyltransferase
MTVKPFAHARLAVEADAGLALRHDIVDHVLVHGSLVSVRYATSSDAAAVADLARELAQSFPFSQTRFDANYAALLNTDDACLLLAVNGDNALGYLLGFQHITFYANGPVATAEEILVQAKFRRRGVGQALMKAFEQWALERNCRLVTLATRRAVPFYVALGYEQSATYMRKVLTDPQHRDRSTAADAGADRPEIIAADEPRYV